MSDARPKTTALVLCGGGARGAYQVGALRALHELLPAERTLPFPILVGNSAGSITNAFLGARAGDFPTAVGRLVEFWSGLRVDDVFRTDARTLARVGLSWAADLSLGSWIGTGRGKSLLLNEPLGALLVERLDMTALRESIDRGLLRGFALTATSYRTGLAVTFFDGVDAIEAWTRSTRIGVRRTLTVAHVMASASIPFFFPAVPIDGTYYADGCVRLTAPLSPAVHLGADRILAIGIRSPRRPAAPPTTQEVQKDAYPTVADTSGMLLNALFLEALESDVERLQRVNRTLELLPHATVAERRTALRSIPLFVLQPSLDLGELARSSLHRLPYLVRHLFRGLGANESSGWDLLSYLAFDSEYTSRLVALGHADVLARRGEILRFLGCTEAVAAVKAVG